MTLSSQSIKKKKKKKLDWRKKRQIAFVMIAKCIEMQLKIVNDFLTEIYISCPIDFKVVFIC